MMTEHPFDTSPGEGPGGWYFHCDAAREILAAARAGQGQITLSLDLNLSQGTWAIDDRGLVLDQDRPVCLALDLLGPVADAENRVFLFDGSRLSPLEIRSDAYYKLVPTDSVPCLEINGIKMHRSKDIEPLADAEAKTKRVVKSGDIVLDTCGGLGYSAIFAVKAGAARVVSCEKSPAVLKLRAANPWTRPGAFDWLDKKAFGRISLEQGDVCRRILEFDDQSFDAVVHDPPRFSSATGDLYGREFYKHLARVLRPGGRLFHYTGSPKRIKNGNRFVANAKKRLEEAGFSAVVFMEALQGLAAQKGPGRQKKSRKRP